MNKPMLTTFFKTLQHTKSSTMLSNANHKCRSQPKASQQDIDELLYKRYGVKKITVNKSSGVTKEDHLVRKCSKDDESEKDGETHLKKHDCASRFNHLKSCMCDGGEVESMKLRYKNLKKSRHWRLFSSHSSH